MCGCLKSSDDFKRQICKIDFYIHQLGKVPVYAYFENSENCCSLVDVHVTLVYQAVC